MSHIFIGLIGNLRIWVSQEVTSGSEGEDSAWWFFLAGLEGIRDPMEWSKDEKDVKSKQMIVDTVLCVVHRF